MTVKQRVDYHKYMASRAWAIKREAVKKRAEGICERCRDANLRDIHHLTYENLGAEYVDSDLLGVCRPCHEFLSAKRDDDPAERAVLRAIETNGLTPTLMQDGDWDSLMDWSTGPTSKGRHFYGLLTPTNIPWHPLWDDYHDATRLIVPLPDGIWYQCNSH
tara:strand:- start:1858 stop:2340 length:483 start_codon:yes stop_codon:yes gene_type:complete